MLHVCEPVYTKTPPLDKPIHPHLDTFVVRETEKKQRNTDAYIKPIETKVVQKKKKTKRSVVNSTNNSSKEKKTYVKKKKKK